MHALNHTLEKYVIEADGAYLDGRKLQPLEQFLSSYQVRLNTYHHLRDHSPKLVLKALQQLAHEYPELIKQHGKRCQYDMTEVLRYIALSVLRDDEVFFMEQMMAWLDTIILAYKKTKQCASAYRHLQDAVNTAMPAPEADLIRPYLEKVISMLQSHA
jgi:hypothetical protein